MVAFQGRKIGIVGAGRIGEAMIKGLVDNGLTDIIASRRNTSALSGLANSYGIRTTSDNKEVADDSDIVVLAVKPYQLNEVLSEIASAESHQNPAKLYLSVAAGKKMASVASILGQEARIARAMTNIAFLVGKGATAYSLNSNCDEADRRCVAAILETGGYATQIREEGMDAVTALSGSGPAFLSSIFESLEKAAVWQGLSPGVAKKLLHQTIAGTLALINDKGMAYATLIDMVKTPRGTTEAGLEHAKQCDLDMLLKGMIAAAKERAEKLGT
ncbi:pyrroline-5-carboxylate reductase [Candidatus Woesearchaeota archaeon]|nr:pyrroline-5-carboxylate reductase [Candidatus Woesearchaeota archaeon]